MFAQIKRLGSDTAIYGISTVVGRFLTFLLTPLYAHILSRGDVGIVATVFAYVAFLNVLYGYGMESAFFKFSSSLEVGDRKQNFSVPFVSLCVTSFVFTVWIVLNAGSIASLIHLSDNYNVTVKYAALILLLDAVAIVPFASLRLARKAKWFATLKLMNIVINVACNILFLFKFDMGVDGIFLSGVISSGITLLFLIPTIKSNFSTRWTGKLYADLLKFGLPYVPAGIATMMIQVIDRPILESLTDKATVGLYQANYRLGIFMMLVVSMFDFAWRPFFFSHAHDPNAKRLFARVLTYFILVMSGLFLVLGMFIEDIVRLPIFFGYSILPQSYWVGLSIVPVVLLAYMFLGISNNLVAGIYIEKKTTYLPGITFIGALVNVVANFILIPQSGIMGAAIATLLSYVVMAVGVYVVAQRVYPVQYELGRISKIFAAMLVVFGLHYTVTFSGYEVVWKCCLLLLFGALMYWMKFFEPSEFGKIAKVFVKHREVISPTEVPTDEGA
jgi:O-antigen/teichoic acid export membrane protein